MGKVLKGPKCPGGSGVFGSLSGVACSHVPIDFTQGTLHLSNPELSLLALGTEQVLISGSQKHCCLQHYSLSTGGEIICLQAQHRLQRKRELHIQHFNERSQPSGGGLHIPFSPFPSHMYLPKPTKHEGSLGLTASGLGFLVKFARTKPT